MVDPDRDAWGTRAGEGTVVDAELHTSTDLRSVDDATLVAAAAMGDREAFEIVVHRHGRALHRYARRMLANEYDVADVVQETFVSAWRQLPNFRSEARLQTWLFTICQRRVVDSYRKRRAEPIDDRLLEAVPATHAGTDPFTSASNNQFLDALEAALRELPQRQRAAWVLREIEGMTFAEIGQVLDLSPDAVRGQHHRGSRTLGLRLERWR